MTYPSGSPDQRLTFDPTSVPEPDRENTFEPIPDGWYRAQIIESEVRPTKAGGSGLNLQWMILGPASANHRVFQWINLTHPTSEEAVRLGRGELYRVCQALGIRQVQRSSSELHGRPCDIRVVIERKPDRDPRNVIRELRAMPRPEVSYHAQPPTSYQTPPQQVPQAPPPSPWAPLPQHQAQPQQAAQVPQAAPFANDDIPF